MKKYLVEITFFLEIEAETEHGAINCAENTVLSDGNILTLDNEIVSIAEVSE